MSNNCPVNIKAQRSLPCHATVSGIAYCPSCGAPMCPICHRHNVTQLSRVTGYISDASGWNAAKKQELKDRTRYNLSKKVS